MTDDWRVLLYYPLGVLPLFFFTARFLVQWTMSEMEGRCVVPKSFWWLSIGGHTLMVLHSCLQLQFHVGLTQACSGVIAWRNINLMGSLQKRVSTRAVIGLMAAAILLITAFFFMQTEWFRAPKLPWSSGTVELAFGWHIFGTLGLVLFSGRFWVQWWQAERSKQSLLTAPFWWMSLAGNTMTLIYFTLLMDPINCVGPLFAMVPYLRNIILLRRTVS